MQNNECVPRIHNVFMSLITRGFTGNGILSVGNSTLSSLLTDVDNDVSRIIFLLIGSGIIRSSSVARQREEVTLTLA